MADGDNATRTTNTAAPKSRPARVFRTIVLCALAGAPAACGPSAGPVQEPRPVADAGAASDVVAAPAYGVPVEPPNPAVEEYGVVAPPDDGQYVMEYGVPLPEPGR